MALMSNSLQEAGRVLSSCGLIYAGESHLVYSRTHSFSNLPFQSAAGEHGDAPSLLSAWTVKPDSTATPDMKSQLSNEDLVMARAL